MIAKSSPAQRILRFRPRRRVVWGCFVAACLLWVALHPRIEAAENNSDPSTCGPVPFVDVARLIPDAVVSMKYATADHFLKRPIADYSRCALRRPVAERLVRAAERLRKAGYRLVLWDCYRPRHVQEAMWRVHPVPGEVANPKTGSHHNRGAAVDVALADASGRLVALPTGFDDFSPQAWRNARDIPVQAKANREALKSAMAAAGFGGIRREWWHYNAPRPKQYALCNAPVAHLLGPVETASAKLPNEETTSNPKAER